MYYEDKAPFPSVGVVELYFEKKFIRYAYIYSELDEAYRPNVAPSKGDVVRLWRSLYGKKFNDKEIEVRTTLWNRGKTKKG